MFLLPKHWCDPRFTVSTPVDFCSSFLTVAQIYSRALRFTYTLFKQHLCDDRVSLSPFPRLGECLEVPFFFLHTLIVCLNGNYFEIFWTRSCFKVLKAPPFTYKNRRAEQPPPPSLAWLMADLTPVTGKPVNHSNLQQTRALSQENWTFYKILLVY